MSTTSSPRTSKHEDEDEGEDEYEEEISRSSGYIRRNKIDDSNRWEPCMMSVSGNRFSINLGSDGISCGMDVCVVKRWKPSDPTEELPLDEFSTYFSCSGLISGSDLLETFICCSLDALNSWYGVMEVSVSRMSLRNLRVFGMHDVEGYKLIHSKYFSDLVEQEEPALNQPQLENRPNVVSANVYPFFPHFALLFVVGWAFARFVLSIKVVTMSSDLLFALCGAVFFISRDSALPWQRKAGNGYTNVGKSPNRGRADAEVFDCEESTEGTSVTSDESWKKFKDSTTVGRLLRPGVVLKTHEEFAAAFAASGHNKWVTPPGELFWLRGKKYLEDKQKYQSLPCYFTLIGCDLWKVVPTVEGGPGPQRSIGYHPQSYVQKVLRNPNIDPVVAAQVAKGGDIHIFVVNFLLPIGNFVGYFLRPYHADWLDSSEKGTDSDSDTEAKMNAMAAEAVQEDAHVEESPAMTTSEKLTRTLYEAFIHGDDEYRNKRFKLCPRVFDGPWLVKRAVGKGDKSAKLAEQMPLYYDRGPNHFEVMIDVSQSAIGNRILSVVSTYIKSVTIDLGMIIEGTNAQELPERVLGALRFYALDIEGAPYLPPHTHKDQES